MSLLFNKGLRSSLDGGRLASSYLMSGICLVLIVANVAAFLMLPMIAVRLGILISNAITVLLMLMAFRPINNLLQRSFEDKAREYMAREKEVEDLRSAVTTLENRNRELESRIDTSSQLSGAPSNVTFAFKVETMTYDKSGYVVKEEPLEKFMSDPAYRLSEKKGIFEKLSHWMDDVVHPGEKKVLYIGKFYAKASLGIDFTKIKYAIREEGMVLFGVKFSKLNDLAVTPDPDEVSHCWLLNEDEMGISINPSGLYAEFTDAYSEIRSRESEKALSDEVEKLCDNYTAIFRKNLSARFPGISFCDHIEDSTETWYSLKDHIQDGRIYPIASNMFLMADVLSGSAAIQPTALLPG